MRSEEARQTVIKGRGHIVKGTLFLIFALTILFLSFNYGGKANATDSGDTLAGAQFELLSGGVSIGFFTECTGIGSATEVVEQRVMGTNGEQITRKIPGRLIWNNIILKRGITSNKDMWTWRKQVEDGSVNDARKNISIVMYDQTMTQVAKWDLINGWLSNITTSAGTNGNMQEEVILVSEGEIRVN